MSDHESVSVPEIPDPADVFCEVTIIGRWIDQYRDGLLSAEQVIARIQVLPSFVDLALSGHSTV